MNSKEIATRDTYLYVNTYLAEYTENAGKAVEKLHNQYMELNQFCRNNSCIPNKTSYDVIEDEALDSKEELKEVLDDIALGKVECLVVYRKSMLVSNCSKEAYEMLEYMINQHDCKLLILHDN